ncbi:MAG: hypothetical protein HY000_06985 [Planctomycetes bacterium]|nr:hypothetical protein [Planctomycetota bacterium]
MEIEQAHEQWEHSLEKYRRHLVKVGPRLNASVRVLAESLCLHDADILSVTSQAYDAITSLAVLTTRQASTVTCLIYLLAQEPLTQSAPAQWPFSKDKVHWLYDEFDVLPTGVQQHEILMSDGRTITFRFHEMQLIEHSFGERLAVA